MAQDMSTYSVDGVVNAGNDGSGNEKVMTT